MGVLKQIVDSINTGISTELAKNSRRFADYKIFGISESVTSGKQTFPAVFKNREGKYAGINSLKSIIVYHKAGNITTAVETNSGYGDKRARLLINSYRLEMVVFSNMEKTCLTPDELLIFLQSLFPETVAVNDFERVTVEVSSAILNKQQVFNNEYRGVQNFLTPELSLISVAYAIEGWFKKTCFNSCPDGASIAEVERCQDPVIMAFHNVSQLNIPYSTQLRSLYGDVPTVGVWKFDGAEYVKLNTDVGFIDYPPSAIVADLGGVASGFVKIS